MVCLRCILASYGKINSSESVGVVALLLCYTILVLIVICREPVLNNDML
jgi:hypothetical protein